MPIFLSSENRIPHQNLIFISNIEEDVHIIIEFIYKNM